MSTNKIIADAATCQSGNMICKICGHKITTGEYLIVEHYISKRGNEDDYNENFHYACTAEQKVWADHFHQQEVEEQKFQANQNRLIKLATEKLKSCTLIHIQEDEDGHQHISFTWAQ